MAAEDIGAQEYWNHARRWILTALIIGLAIKTPVPPFHTWFAPASSEGSYAVSVILLGAGLRVGPYAFVRFVGPLCGDFGAGIPLLSGLLSLGALYESFVSLGHRDLRKIAAHAGLSQSALAIAGLFSLQLSGHTGALLLTLGSGMASTLLVFAFAFIETRSVGTELLGPLAGFLTTSHSLRYRWVAPILFMAALSIIGIPGLCEFAGLYASLGAIFEISWSAAFLALAAGLIISCAFVWMLQRVVFGDTSLPQLVQHDESDGPDRALIPHGSDGPHAQVAQSRPNLGRLEILALAPLFAGIFMLGLWPQALVEFLRISLRIAFAPF